MKKREIKLALHNLTNRNLFKTSLSQADTVGLSELMELQKNSKKQRRSLQMDPKQLALDLQL